MASSDNLATIDPWMFRSTIGDAWCSDAFARETESALTKALQQSFFGTNQQQYHHNHQINHPIPNSNNFLLNQSDYCITTPSVSTLTVSGSGSEPETPGSKRRGGLLGVSMGKPAKRKSRASKRSMTTFIQADPSNFRQMVQQVTGVKLGDGQMPVNTVVKPEPMRQPFINKLQGLLPTLDTSAYLLHHQNNRNTQTHRIPVSGSGGESFSQLPAVNQLTEGGGAGVDFYSFSSFPTLESSF